MRRVLGATLLVALATLALSARPAGAQTPPSIPPPTTAAPTEDGGQVDTGGAAGTPDQPPVTLPLVPVPVGCTAPPLPHVVFVGKLVDSDFRSGQFRIEQVRSGNPAPFASDDRINIRYGLDVQYLQRGERYLVSAPVDPDLGLLVSRVTPVMQNFGGDEVIGVSESDVNCPKFDDPMRTLHLDGTPVEASMVKPFFDAKLRILGAFAIPLAVALAAIFVLASLRLSVAGVYRSVRQR